MNNLPFDYSPHSFLLKLAQNSDKDIKLLDLSKQSLNRFPPSSFLIVFQNIEILNFSNNKIEQFDSNILITACPKLEILNLSNNNIKDVSFIKQLKGLLFLKDLDFSENPIVKNNTHAKLLEVLIIPENLVYKNAVQLISRAHKSVCFTDLSNLNQQSRKLLTSKIEFKNKESIFVFKKPSSKSTIFPYFGNKKCPTRKTGDFTKLEFLNKKEITFKDLLTFWDFKRPSDITDPSHIKKIIEQQENSLNQKNDLKNLVNKNGITQKSVSKNKFNSKLIQNYLRRHQKSAEKFADLNCIKSREPDVLKYLFQIDKENQGRKFKRELIFNRVDTLWNPEFKILNQKLRPKTAKEENSPIFGLFQSENKSIDFNAINTNLQNKKKHEVIEFNEKEDKTQKYNFEKAKNSNVGKSEKTYLKLIDDTHSEKLKAKFLNFEDMCSILPIKSLLNKIPEEKIKKKREKSFSIQTYETKLMKNKNGLFQNEIID